MVVTSLPTDPASMSATEVCKALEVDPAKGLSTEEVAAREAEFGRNELPEEKPTPFWQLVMEQFEDELVRILLVAAAVSFVMAVVEKNVADFVDPFIILLILIMNAVVGVWQETSAEEAIKALKSFVPSHAVVMRNGETFIVEAETLVPGDIMEVSAGSRVSADVRLLALESTTFRVDEAILSGESEETLKQVETVAKSRRKRFADNLIFSGTAVVYGKARGVVVRTGSATEIGAIERDVREQDDKKTPLQLKLDEFGVLLSKVIGYVCFAVFAINMINWYRTAIPTPNQPWYERYIQPAVHCLKVAVALAVAAIPEGLPAVVTTCLALGTRRMARHNVLVRDLPSVETLGRCTVICSDKTGTLTTNMMSVLQVVTLGPHATVDAYHLHDTRFNPLSGAVSVVGKSRAISSNAALDMISTISTLCNGAGLQYNRETGLVERIGEATEAALLTMAEKLDRDPSDPPYLVDKVRREREKMWRKDATLEFTRSRKSMSVCCTQTGKGRAHNLFVKGAPEEILKRCTHVMLSDGEVVPLTAALRATIDRQMDTMTNQENALRCIGFASRPVADVSKLDLSDPHKFENVEAQMTFVGVCGMIDPPRDEVYAAIEKCHTAGIRVIVITGDKKETAEAICRKIGVLQGPAEGRSFTGEQFDRMSTEQKRKAVLSAAVFSRTDPSHKMQLVHLLQEQGFICAMTGDGVNDSPALKKADIGIAMGTGTEVAKAASKMVLADDNFATLVEAVREGRSIYNNTKQFIRYLISSNIGEVACILVTGLCGLPEALSPIQLLWVNLVTDGLPATALGFNAADPDVMKQPPRSVAEPIVGGWLFVRYMVVGTYVGLATVGGFLWWFVTHGFTLSELTAFATCTDMSNAHCAILADPIHARSIALSILVIIEMMNALNALSENQSLVVTRPSTNPWLILAILSSVFLHLVILYVPFFATMFHVAPLGVDAAVVAAAEPWSVLIPTDFEDWRTVLVFSIPVIFIDEVLKAISRRGTNHH